MSAKPLPPALPGTALRILATSGLGATTVPLPTSHGESGTCAGMIELLEHERQPAIWLDAGDLVVGHPAYPLLGERPWEDVADLPIAAAAAGNHDFDVVLAEVRPGELERAIDAHWAMADPRNAAADAVPWNWCRMPAGVSGVADATSRRWRPARPPATRWWER